jgi:hypothetical protein
MTTSRDLLLLLALFGVLGVAVVGVFLARRRVASLLTRAEWIVLLKLVGIVLFLFLLYLVKITRGFPAEMFIYGRF